MVLIASTPSFNSFFTVTKFIGFACGIIVLKPRHRWNYFDHIINASGYVQAIQVIWTLLISVPYVVFSNNFPFLNALGAILPGFYALDSIGKFIYLKKYGDKIQELMQEFHTTYESKEGTVAIEKDVVKSLKRDKKIITLFLSSTVLCNAIFIFLPLVASYVIYTKTKEWNPMPIVPAWYPFDKQKYFWPIYIHECIMAHDVPYWMAVPDGIFCNLLLLLNFFFSGLALELEEIINVEAERNVFGSKTLVVKLKELIIYHNRLISLTEQVNDVFAYIVVSRFLSSAFFVCCCGFVLVVSILIL